MMSPGTRYQYRLGHFRIRSALELPELDPLPATAAEPDIEILLDPPLGPVLNAAAPADRRDAEPTRQSSELAWFEIPGVARYQLEQGRRIRVRPAHHSSPDEVRAYLLGTAYGVLCHQRDTFVLHASATIDNGGHAVAFAGQSGSGKSTTGAWLAAQGYTLLTDDVCTITEVGTELPVVQPGPPRIKLWRDTLRVLGVEPTGLRRDSSRADKYHLVADRQTSATGAPLAAIYLLDGRIDAPAAAVEGPIDHLDAIAAMVEHTYRVETLGPLGLTRRHFERCAALVRRVPVFRLHRPRALAALPAVVDALESHWTGTDRPTADK